jgi:hypothetical protein
MAWQKNGSYGTTELRVDELAVLGPIGTKTPYTETIVRIVRLNDEPNPRVDIRQFKTTKDYTGWAKGASLTLEQYAEFKALIGRIDAALAEELLHRQQSAMKPIPTPGGGRDPS